MTGILIGFVLGIPAGLIANYFSPPFSKWVTGLLGSLAHRWDPDHHDLTGTWQATTEEPDSNGKDGTVKASRSTLAATREIVSAAATIGRYRTGRGSDLPALMDSNGSFMPIA